MDQADKKDLLREALERFRFGASPREDFEPLFKLLYRFVLIGVRQAGGAQHRNRAEDVTQEILFRVYQEQGRIETEPGSFLRWLATVIKNDARSRWRRGETLKRAGEKHQVSISAPGSTRSDVLATDLWTGPPARADARALEKEREERLYRALASLSLQQRKVLALRVRKGLAESEIAAVLGISVETVRVHRKRAFRVLRERLSKDFEHVET